jgi:hypothetical protein
MCFHLLLTEVSKSERLCHLDNGFVGAKKKLCSFQGAWEPAWVSNSCISKRVGKCSKRGFKAWCREPWMRGILRKWAFRRDHP